MAIFLSTLELEIVLSKRIGGLPMTRFAWSLLLLVAGYPHAIPIAGYDSQQNCEQAITKMIAHPYKEFKLECRPASLQVRSS